MAIKSHYGAAKDGEVSSGNMSARNSVGSNTEIYMPCVESASPIVDVSQNAIEVADNAGTKSVVNGTLANTMKLLISSAGLGVIPDVGDVANASPNGESFVFFLAGNSAASPSFVKFGLGGSGSGHVFMSSTAGFTISDGIQSKAIGLTGVEFLNDDTVLLAGVVNRETDVATGYSAVNDHTNVHARDSRDISVIGDITFSNLIELNSFFAADTYGFGLRVFPNGIPETIESDIQELFGNLLSGAAKPLPTNWVVNH